MTNKFDKITLAWGGNDYEIAENRVMGAIHQVEKVITLGELQEFAARRTAPLGILASAYGNLLRYAGAKIADEEIYIDMLKNAGAGAAVAAIANVMMLMIPPELRAKSASEGGGTAAGN